MASTRARWREGALVKIPLPGGLHGYGRLRRQPLISVYDRMERQVASVADVVNSPVLFSVWVMKRALTVWPMLGHAALEPALCQPQAFLKRDALTGRLTVYTDGREQPPTDHQVRSLEPAAVWDPEHVVDRIVDNYEGRPNKWLEAIRNKARAEAPDHG